jgi:hypothetical protein
MTAAEHNDHALWLLGLAECYLLFSTEEIERLAVLAGYHANEAERLALSAVDAFPAATMPGDDAITS